LQAAVSWAPHRTTALPFPWIVVVLVVFHCKTQANAAGVARKEEGGFHAWDG
jgi:hypothetical protein